jgi:hypothetical protein
VRAGQAGGTDSHSRAAKQNTAVPRENAEQSGIEQLEAPSSDYGVYRRERLANLIDVSYADIISKCMSLEMVSINQRLKQMLLNWWLANLDTL